MSLTKKEAEVVIKRLREYPAGVGAMFWGYGPIVELMRKYSERPNFDLWWNYASREMLQEYG